MGYIITEGVWDAAETLTVLDADLGYSVGHVIGIHKLRLGHTVTLGDAKDMVGNAILHGQLAGFAIEEPGLVKGMGKETLNPSGTEQVT